MYGRLGVIFLMALLGGCLAVPALAEDKPIEPAGPIPPKLSEANCAAFVGAHEREPERLPPVGKVGLEDAGLSWLDELIAVLAAVGAVSTGGVFFFLWMLFTRGR